ncbi:MAG: HdeD family acid-resistance protein [Bacteroidales bacterium]|jgi:uncharacterized membrane protein HdeD (DUF308 family)|nr:HdeD family acid-resistance protein [Bacteroidales bacterium]
MKQTFKKIEKAIKRWYLMLIVGVVFIVLGIWTFATPADAYAALSFVFAFGFLINGITEVIFAFDNRHQNWGWSLALGILSAIVGILLLLNPATTMVTLPYYIGFTLLFRSISGMVTAYDMKQYGILDWGTLMVTAVLGLIFSFILLWNPMFAGVSVVIWTALAFILLGCYSIYFSFKLRKLNKMMKEE